jgi:acetoin utilization deacetylase AcuC-like enzyme
MSVHQDGYYPADSGSITEVGAGDGRGYNINVPLPAGSGTGAYREAFSQVIIPALRDYRPELILVSCGLDASALEPQGQMMLHSDGYRMLAETVVSVADEVCGGRLVLCHEGGYSTTYTPFCGLAVVETIAGTRTAVRDPYLEAFAAIAGQALQAHQTAAIQAARAAVLQENVLALEDGGAGGPAR